MAEQNKQQWSLRVSHEGIVIISGEIDYTCTPAIRDRMHELINKTAGDFVLDLSGLHYLDSSGLAIFIEARKILLDNNRVIRIVDASTKVRKIFKLTQVSKLFDMQ